LLNFLLLNFYFLICFTSCSITKQISKQANTILLHDPAISTGHIGISIYEPATNKYWYNYDATKYFIPASNTKLFTLYAGMKYLGDSLVGLRYEEYIESIHILPTGDPTFLHEGFINQPVYDFLKKSAKPLNVVGYAKVPAKFKKYGPGWAWDDAEDDYMAERTEFPIYGNMTRITIDKDSNVTVVPEIPGSSVHFTKLPPSIEADMITENKPVKKFVGGNMLINTRLIKLNSVTKIPFSDLEDRSLLGFIRDTLYNHNYNKEIELVIVNDTKKSNNNFKIIHSQPSDSLFKPMMHRSDNFFAEQTLLMASNEHLGYMSDEAIIDSLLSNDLKDIPQRPKWVDGSGLSRYNLFTPQSFVYILNKTKNEFGWDRQKNILATGGTGTLANYFKDASGFIYAKTGTLSNNCALSGFLITKKGKLLIFSVLTNNYITGATPVRRAVEKFLLGIREKY